MRIATCIALLLFTPFGSADDFTSLSALADDMRTTWKVPGLVVVVVKGDRTLILSGLGHRDRESQQPVTSKTLFPIGSCTKAFTSAAVASLVTDQKLSFDDTVRKHLKSFKLSEPIADAQVTLRDLLSHRTGLNGHDLLWYRAPWSLEVSVKRIEHLELTGPFRKSFYYNSLTVAAAGMAAGNAADQTWEQLVRKRITEPLVMKSIAFTTTQAKAFPDRAKGYRRTAQNQIEPMSPYEMKEPNPAGSIQLSGCELDKWLKYQLRNNSAVLAETKTPQIEVPLTDAVKPYHPHGTMVQYGMGWLIYDYRGSTVVAHGGMIDGFRSQVTLVPEEKIGIAIVNNLHESKLNLALTTAIIDRLLKFPKTDWTRYYLDLEQRERDDATAHFETIKRTRQPELKASFPLERFVASYRNPAYGEGTIQLEAGQLIWKWSSFRCPLDHWEGNVFRITEGFLENRFVEFRVETESVKALRFAEQIFDRKK